MCSSVAEYLPSTCNALDSPPNPSPQGIPNAWACTRAHTHKTDINKYWQDKENLSLKFPVKIIKSLSYSEKRFGSSSKGYMELEDDPAFYP